MIGVLIEAESLNRSLSTDYEIEVSATDATLQYIGYYGNGSSICYDAINMTGVKSITFEHARGTGSLAGFEIRVDDPFTGPVLAGQFTESTGGWEEFRSLNVGLDEELTGEHLLCFTGALGTGIFNLDSFTLSDQPGTNTGLDINNDEPPMGAEVPAITTQGNQLLFGGEPGSIAGMSLFWSQWDGGYYTKETVAWLKSDWNAKLVRAAMAVDDEGGYIADPVGNQFAVQTVVNAAIENEMYVIIDWHSHHAEDYAAEAVEFFSEMAAQYGDYNNVIYEVYNEPLAVSWSGVIKPYAENVISAIRAQDPDNLIIVGTPNWSQDVHDVVADPINDPNVAYTLHFYAASHKQDLRDKASTALNAGLPLFVTEWGTINANGDGDVDTAETETWMNFLRSNGVSHANWALNDKEEGSSALIPGSSTTGGWTDSDLTASGKLVKGIIQNW